MSDLPYIERVKIQAEILLPLYKRLRNELGDDKAKELLRAAVNEFAQNLGDSIRNNKSGTSLEKLRQVVPMFAAGESLDVEPVADTPDELTMNVKRCAYAEYFHGLGEPEFGAMLTCEIDPPMTKGIGEDLSLERTKTLMSGDSHCDFHWKLKG